MIVHEAVNPHILLHVCMSVDSVYVRVVIKESYYYYY